jgi:hypothetical protein
MRAGTRRLRVWEGWGKQAARQWRSGKPRELQMSMGWPREVSAMGGGTTKKPRMTTMGTDGQQ